jgi:hypothetical protein
MMFHPLMGMGAGQKPMPMMNAPTEDFDQADFVIEPIVAWRAWTAVVHPKRGPYLQSITHHMRWPRRIPSRAHCLTQMRVTNLSVQRHSSPSLRHHCGIHSVKKPEDAQRWTTYGSNLRIMGAVNIWGRVLRYTEGYLSEYAYPTGVLYMHTTETNNLNYRDLAHGLSEAYGVEVQLGVPMEWQTAPS